MIAIVLRLHWSLTWLRLLLEMWRRKKLPGCYERDFGF